MADDNDFEAELLDLAGRGASSKKRVRDSDESSENSDDDGPKRSRRKGGPSKQQRGGKRTVDTDSEDDPDEEAEFSDEFGSDLYGDDEDRARLEAMTELEREMILADRAEKRDKARQRREILQKAKGADKVRARHTLLCSLSSIRCWLLYWAACAAVWLTLQVAVTALSDACACFVCALAEPGRQGRTAVQCAPEEAQWQGNGHQED